MSKVLRKIWTEQLLRYGLNSYRRVYVGFRVCVELLKQVTKGGAQHEPPCFQVSLSSVLYPWGRARLASSLTVDIARRAETLHHIASYCRHRFALNIVFTELNTRQEEGRSDIWFREEHHRES